MPDLARQVVDRGPAIARGRRAWSSASTRAPARREGARRTTSSVRSRTPAPSPPAAQRPRSAQRRPAHPVPPRRRQAERTAESCWRRTASTIADRAEIRIADYPPASWSPRIRRPAARSRSPCSSIAASDGASYVMPDLIGRTAARRRHPARAASASTVVGRSPYPGLPPGVVIRQTPAGGIPGRIRRSRSRSRSADDACASRRRFCPRTSPVSATTSPGRTRRRGSRSTST